MAVAVMPRGRRLAWLPSWLMGGVLILVWGTVVGYGFAKLWRYSYTPGRAADAAETWPTASHLTRDPDRPTLVLTLSAGCPCSQATLGELARLLARAPGKATVHAVFDVPANAATPIEQTRLWHMARDIPGVVVIADRDGREAAAFGAYVSGQAYLYDATGRRRFSGGLTAARGHAGDNDGAETVVALLTRAEASLDRTPVFGCLLEDRSPP